MSISLFMFYNMVTFNPYFYGRTETIGDTIKYTGIIISDKYLIKEADMEIYVKDIDNNILESFNVKYKKETGSIFFEEKLSFFNESTQYISVDYRIINVKVYDNGNMFISALMFIIGGFCFLDYILLRKEEIKAKNL